MKRKQKRERTNYAPEQAAMDAIERSLSLEDAMGEFRLSKQAERVAERTIRDYKTHFRYFRTWLDVSYSGGVFGRHFIELRGRMSNYIHYYRIINGYEGR